MNLRELSQVLGLSQTTVSRALNGYPEVSEATRQKVAAAARKHNYRPNTRAKGLATGRAMAIGHVIPVSSQHEVVNPVFADFIAGAGEIYARHGYDMMLSLTGNREEARLYRDLGAKRSVDGIIVHAPRVEDDRLDLLQDINLPFVVHGRFGGPTDGYNWLDMNNRRAFARATGFLAELGHRRIALINGLESMDFAARRRDGYLEALNNHALSPDPALMVSHEMTEFNGYDATLALLDLPCPPTALLTSSMISALGVRRACHERGLVMGRDISLISHDDDLSYFRNGGRVPDFTSLRSPVRDHGRRAAEMLLRVIDDPDSTPITELLEAELQIGLSTGPAPAPLRPARQG
ncbi:LacI family DNA-binding transcriptional regulator [Oceaniglobus trochenteri]|uniref:LacI family DNA-binding transcriptional regulator n=1 Tax=Oceaniglobus trochenteri TaxID=2763260 RepID=UPI001CFFCEE3|nr:substrate-binding domain-containing protein [Oceaniglobus trochenteri]